MVLSGVMFVHCLYLAKLNPVIPISDKAQLDDGSNVAGSSLLSTTIFLPTTFACWRMSLQFETHS